MRRALGPRETLRAVPHLAGRVVARGYAFAARAANDGLWDWNTVTGQIYLSQRCRDLLDTPADATPDERTLIRRVHPE
ncbi:MAG: hypothetical protein R6X34_03260, partial [Chloroflexota bacterium]